MPKQQLFKFSLQTTSVCSDLVLSGCACSLLFNVTAWLFRITLSTQLSCSYTFLYLQKFSSSWYLSWHREGAGAANTKRRVHWKSMLETCFILLNIPRFLTKYSSCAICLKEQKEHFTKSVKFGFVFKKEYSKWLCQHAPDQFSSQLYKCWSLYLAYVPISSIQGNRQCLAILQPLVSTSKINWSHLLLLQKKKKKINNIFPQKLFICYHSCFTIQDQLAAALQSLSQQECSQDLVILLLNLCMWINVFIA